MDTRSRAMGDPFEHADAAYVMGALDPGEATEFEAHLRTCTECRARVDEVSETVALLGGLSAADFTATGEPEPSVPDTLLPAVLHRARTERRRRSVLTAGIAALAAACLVALAVAVWPSADPASRAPEKAFTAVGPSPVAATAVLTSKAWGTEIDLHCKYAQDVDEAHPYGLRVIDVNGAAHGAGSWTLVPGQTIEFTGGTAVRRSQIAELQITRPDGTPILLLDL